MNAADQSGEDVLITRLDDIERRVTHLEQLALDPFGDTAVGPASVEVVSAVPEAAVVVDGLLPSSEMDRSPDYLQSSVTGSEPTTRPAQVGSPAADPPATVPHQLYPAASPRRVRSQPVSSRPAFDVAYIEERLAGRAMALVGGAALILGAIFFLSLAFSRGWIGPEMQVILGLAGGTVGLLIGGLLLLRGDRIVGHVLTAVGLAVISLAFFAAVNVYLLVPPVAGMMGTLVVAAVATVLAIAARSQVVAGFGLVAVLAAPPILGASPDYLTLAYMVIVLTGVAAVSLWRTWPWLPPTAFILSAPQVYEWVSTEPAVELAFPALLLYWALMAVAAGGEAFRRGRPELSSSSAPLFMVSGVFVSVTAFGLMPLVSQQVTFLLSLAAMHALIAGFFTTRRGPVDPFGLLAAAYGIALASMAVPLAFGASLTAVVWSAEAAALAVVAGRRAHGPSLVAALVFLALAGLRIAAIAYEAEVEDLYRPAYIGPFDALVVSLCFYLMAALVIGVTVPSRTVRLLIVGMASLVCLPVILAELEGVAAVAGWTSLALAAMTAPRWLALAPERPIDWQLGAALEWLRPWRPTTADAALAPKTAAVLAGALALIATVWATAMHATGGDIPFADQAGLSALIVAGGCLIAGLVSDGADQRRRGILAAGPIVAVEAWFQLPQAWTVVLWTTLATLAFWLGRTECDGRVTYLKAGACGLVVAAVAALPMAPPDRLVVGDVHLAPHLLFVSEATLVLGALAAALLVVAWLHARANWANAALAAAGVAALYLVSIGVVDVFAGAAYRLPIHSERSVELEREAHVALSILWTFVGVLITGAGLVFDRAVLRIGGLAVLTLATAKVFLIDLSSLDIAYRVITLVVLGVLLIASAWVWTHLKPGSDGVSEGEVATGADADTGDAGDADTSLAAQDAMTKPRSGGITPA